MKIIKYEKINGGKYLLTLDNNVKIKIYEDIILKENLLIKGEVNDLEKLIEINEKYSIYDVSLKYLSHRVTSVYGMHKYLHNKKYAEEDILKTIDKLKSKGYLNDEFYAKSYILNEIKLTNAGPLKIKKHLEEANIPYHLYSTYLEVSDDIWKEKIKKIIDKQVKNNKKSSYNFKNTMMINLLNMGYEREMISDYLDNIVISNEEELQRKEEEKIRKRLNRKYKGEELERKIKERLYAKGFIN